MKEYFTLGSVPIRQKFYFVASSDNNFFLDISPFDACRDPSWSELLPQNLFELILINIYSNKRPYSIFGHSM